MKEDSEFSDTFLIKSPGITDAERKRQLARACDLILSWNDRDTANLGAIGDRDQIGGNTPDPEGQEHNGEYKTCERQNCNVRHWFCKSTRAPSVGRVFDGEIEKV